MNIRLDSWLICFCPLFIACSKSTSPGSRAIPGKVVLEGQTDHSGVRVSLYLPAELDPEIVELNQPRSGTEKYPHIGVPISQHTEFDHRFAVEVAITTTAADGSFELKDVHQGTYNLVAQKEGYGWQYLFDPMTQRPNDPVTCLFRETRVSGLIPSDTVWERDSHYLMAGDVTVPKGCDSDHRARRLDQI